MNNCIHYDGNQYCNLHKSKVASAYCGDICKERTDKPKINIGTIGHIGYDESTLIEVLSKITKEK